MEQAAAGPVDTATQCQMDRFGEKNWVCVTPDEEQDFDCVLRGEKGFMPRIVARMSPYSGSDTVSMEVYNVTSNVAYDLLFPRWVMPPFGEELDIDGQRPEIDRQIRTMLKQIDDTYGHPSAGPIDRALLTEEDLERISPERCNEEEETSEEFMDAEWSQDASQGDDEANATADQNAEELLHGLLQCIEESDNGTTNGSYKYDIDLKLPHEPRPVERNHTCERCGESFVSVIKLNQHLRKNHGHVFPSIFICAECKKSFKNNFSLKRHMQKSHDEQLESVTKGHDCSECTSTFTERKSLYKHMREKHDLEPMCSSQKVSKPKMECYICDKLFSNLSNLNKHKKKVHGVVAGDDGKLQCPLCTECLVNTKKLDSHLQSSHQVSQETELITFSRLEDFNTWKESIEQTTLSHYVKYTGTKSVRGGQRSYFYCHRSGANNCKADEDKQRIRWKSSMKIGSHCTSQIVLTDLSSTSQFQVTYSKVHVGHDVGLQHLQLTKGQREGLATRIKQKDSLNVILDDIRDSVSQETDLSRLHLLERKDLLNIIQEFQLDESKANKNDADSVSFWINEQEKLGDQSVVIFYKPQHESKPDSNLEEQDAMVVIMTPYQQEVLMTYTGDKILVDSTHGTTEYDFQLTTLMTVDEYGAGCAVAFCISNRTDAVAMSEYFNAIKSKVGAISSNIFMSDDAPSYYNAWESVMGPCSHRLLCTWHVDRAWRQQAPLKIKNVEKAAEVYKGCRVLLEEEHVEYFKRLMKGFLNMLKNDPETAAFGEHFETYYARRPEVWAYCYRKRLGLNTNMYLEALHKKFKYIYLDGRKNRRVDKCITALLKFVRDMMFERLIRKSKNKPTKRMLSISASHKKSKQISSEMIHEISTNRWEVKSSASEDVYLVQKIDKLCGCALQCPVCKVCIHQFLCECPDNLIRLNLCKHIHACVSRNPQSNQLQLPSLTDLQEKNIMNIMKKQVPQLLPVGSIVTTQTKLESLFAKVQALAQDIPPEDGEEACKGVQRLIDHFENLIKKKQQPPVPPMPVTPANKKILRQKRFSSTKKKRLTKTQRTFVKPGNMQKALMQYMFIEDENLDEELMTVQSQGDLDHTY